MQDSVFLDNRTFQRVWQRVAGSMDAPVTTPPEADTLTDLLAECIRAKAAVPRRGQAAGGTQRSPVRRKYSTCSSF